MTFGTLPCRRSTLRPLPADSLHDASLAKVTDLVRPQPAGKSTVQGPGIVQGDGTDPTFTAISLPGGLCSTYTPCCQASTPTHRPCGEGFQRMGDRPRLFPQRESVLPLRSTQRIGSTAAALRKTTNTEP